MNQPEMQHPARTLLPAGNDEISVIEMWQALVERKWAIALITIFCGALSAGVSLLITPVYRAEVLLMPVSQTDSSGGALAGLASQFGGLASLAGVSLNSSGSQKEEAIATLQSRLLTDFFVQDNKLLPVLFAAKWDAEGGTWKTKDSDGVPSLWDANALFSKEIRRVTDNKKTGLVTVAIDWTNREQAAQWANELVTRTNVMLRQRAIENSTRNIKYVEEQLNKTGSIELRQALYRLLEVEYKNIMLAQGTEEYAFRVIDPAAVPKYKFKPKRTLITVLGAAAGFMFSVLLVLVALSINSSKRLR